MGVAPEARMLGILGMGGIGKAIAKRAFSIDMNVQYHNRSERPDVDSRCKYVSFDTLLATSDAIVLSLPLNVSKISL